MDLTDEQRAARIESINQQNGAVQRRNEALEVHLVG